MNVSPLNSSVRALVLLFASAASMQQVHAQAVTPVSQLDLDRFTGTWYVVAHLPEKRDKPCDRNSILMVALGDKPRSVQLLNACQTRRGYTEARNTDGKAVDKSGDGKLKFRTIWPFYRKDWVIAISPDYAWSMLGSPNHKNLFLLSRTSTLPPEVLTELKSKAIAEGFSLDKLVTQPQEAKYKAD